MSASAPESEDAWLAEQIAKANEPRLITIDEFTDLEIVGRPDWTEIDYYDAANEDATGEAKPTNPKDAVGVAKNPLSTVPSPFLHALGVAMLEGALKYGRHNYRPAGVRASVYYDAAMRHLTLWWEGEDIDPDSGLPHPVKAAACMAVLHDSILMGNFVDDRPVRNPNFRTHFDQMNALSKALVEKYGSAAKEPFTEIPGVLRKK